jgi:phospholipase/lecithinase/hemolysin
MALGRLLRSLVTALVVVAMPHGVVAQPLTQFGHFYVFGDSLADTGNVWLASQSLGVSPAPPPSDSPHRAYFEGRFSNGPIGFEYLWQRVSRAKPGSRRGLQPYLAEPALGVTAVNFAFGGTGTPLVDTTPGGFDAPGLLGQIQLYRAALAGSQAPADALYAIATGANDYRSDPYNTPMDPIDVVSNIAKGIQELYASGARTILVLGLPDLGRLPYLTPDQRLQGSGLTAYHNALLAGALDQLNASLPGARLIFADINDAFALVPSTMTQNTPALDALVPPSNGFLMSTCLFVDPATCTNVTLKLKKDRSFLFWDILHPTTEAHQLLADFLYARLTQ